MIIIIAIIYLSTILLIIFWIFFSFNYNIKQSKLISLIGVLFCLSGFLQHSGGNSVFNICLGLAYLGLGFCNKYNEQE